MEGIGFSRSFIKLEFDLKMKFQFQNFSAFTITDKEFNKYSGEGVWPKSEFIPELGEPDYSSGFGYLVIDTSFQLAPFDSVTEISAKARPKLLVLLGIISFMGDYPFTPAEIFSSHQTMLKKPSSVKEPFYFERRGENYSSDIIQLLKVIGNVDTEHNVLIFSLFERWRKARFLELDQAETSTYYDEAVLAYMHILEVLSDEYKAELTSKVEDERRKHVSEITSLLSSGHTPESRRVKSLFKEYAHLNVSLKSKVRSLLARFGLENEKSGSILDRFIAHRNDIAHGRRTLFENRAIYPLPQFFSMMKEIDEQIAPIKHLSSAAMSKYLGLNIWQEELAFSELIELPTIKAVKKFIRDRRFSTISNVDFLGGSDNGISPYSIVFYYKRNLILLSELEESTSNMVVTIKLSEKNSADIFDVCLVLADSSVEKVALIARTIIAAAINKNWFPYSNKRDALKEFAYHGKSLIWHTEYLTSFSPIKRK